MKYDFQAIEKKWQARWEEEKPFAAVTGDPRPKFYGLIEFPYPSGQGLHVRPRHRVVGSDDGVLVQHLALEQLAPAQAAHVGLGGLQPHEHVGLGLLPGPVELGLGDAVLGQLPDHGQNGVQRLSLGLPPQGGIDAEVAGIVMAGAVGVDGVAKPLLLPHLLKLNHNPDETVDITWSALQYRLDESVGYPKIG